MISEVRASEYRALALMYVSQGLPTGLAFYGLATLIRASGQGVAQVGWVGLAIVPWAFKFLWASAIDNQCARWGHARVVFATQALAVACALALLAVPLQAHLGAAIAGIVLLNAVCATQDIATNGYAVAHMQGSAAGPANAIQIAGFIVGMLLGGGGLLIAHGRWGWQGAVLLLAGALALSWLLLWLDKGWQAPAPALPATVHLRDLLHHRDLGWALLIALAFKAPSTAVGTLVQPWLLDRGLPLEGIGHLQMTVMLTTATGGIVLGVPLVRRLGNRRAVLAGYALAALVLGAAWTLQTLDVRAPWAYFAAFGAQGFCEGAMFVAVWALFMNWARPQAPGTDFTAMQCSENLTNVLAAGAIGALGQALGYAQAFALAWGTAALALLIVAFSLRRLVLNGESTE
ncbi:MAG: permease [Burkholderiaceae bacterium]|nr:permease [Burkholderiaceae bacterium]